MAAKMHLCVFVSKEILIIKSDHIVVISRKQTNKFLELSLSPTADCYLCNTFGTSPVAFGHFLQGRDQAEGVITVVTAVTQEQPVLFVASATHHAKIKVNLGRRGGGKGL